MGDSDVLADIKVVKMASMVFVEVEQPPHGRFRTIASPISLSDVEKAPPRPAPQLGEHSRQALKDIGYSEQEITELMAGGVVV